MSFSVSIPADTPLSEVPAVFDSQVAAYPDSPGKEEANLVRDEALALFTKFCGDAQVVKGGSIYGSKSGGQISFGFSAAV